MTPFRFFTAVLALFLSARIAGGGEGEPSQRDREAILAMAGEFEVLFNFEETVGYVDGYRLKDPYQEEATEIVIVAEDTGLRIALQHILQTGTGKVVKHWKQIWTWQDRRLVEFQGRGEWRVRQLDEDEVAGRWSQLVTQVDDSPRYQGIGKWVHDRGVSLWESNRVARPLPRREHTARSDYDILMAVNRHALTPHGWVHEQDNLKLVLERDGEPAYYLAGETGVNYYDRTEEVDFAPARDYWDRTKAFWRDVSEIWESVMDSESRFALAEEVDGRPLHRAMSAMAEGLVEEPEREAPAKKEIRETLDSYLETGASVDESEVAREKEKERGSAGSRRIRIRIRIRSRSRT
ncbi:MAG: DUF6607 family protein [Verrucomicrobiales bacterium]